MPFCFSFRLPRNNPLYVAFTFNLSREICQQRWPSLTCLRLMFELLVNRQTLLCSEHNFFRRKQMLAYCENLSPTGKYWAMQKKLAACTVFDKIAQP